MFVVAYYFRLPTKFIKEDDPNHQIVNLREYFVKKIEEVKPHQCRHFFLPFVKHQLQDLFNKMVIPPGIAPTQAVLENLFCNVVCIETKIPLIVTGPPGCSKTLSFN